MGCSPEIWLGYARTIHRESFGKGQPRAQPAPRGNAEEVVSVRLLFSLPHPAMMGQGQARSSFTCAPPRWVSGTFLLDQRDSESQMECDSGARVGFCREWPATGLNSIQPRNGQNCQSSVTYHRKARSRLRPQSEHILF